MIFKYSTTTVLALAAAITLSGCGTPANLDLSLDKPTAAEVFHVTLMPPAQAPAINQLHSWKVVLTTPAGTPVQHAQISVGGGMPQHGHGFPTQPKVTRELEAGTYLLEGMKFSMAGWWDIKLDIQSPQGSDKVVFNTVVNVPPVKQ